MGYFANSDEGVLFEEAWCSRCVHSDISGDREIGVDPPCPVLLAHSLFAYELCNDEKHPGKVMLDMLITRKTVTASDGHPLPVNECAMFHPVDAGAAVPGQLKIGDAA